MTTPLCPACLSPVRTAVRPPHLYICDTCAAAVDPLPGECPPRPALGVVDRALILLVLAFLCAALAVLISGGSA